MSRASGGRGLGLQYREKCSGPLARQALRCLRMGLVSGLPAFRQGVLKCMFGLTYDCQCSCDYCCSGLYPRDGERELRGAEIRQALEEISRIPSLCTLVSFFGGEALLRGHIFEDIAHAVRLGLFTETETNGILLSPETARRLKAAGLHHIFVRVESAREAEHDAVSHYDGCFRRAVEGIRQCVAAGLSCSVSTIAWKEKIASGGLEEVIRLARALGARSVRLLHPTPAGKSLARESALLSEAEKKAVQQLLDPRFVYLESTSACTRTSSRVCPSAEKKMFYISCYGQVQPCPFVSLGYGDIHSVPLAEILRQMWRAPLFPRGHADTCLAEHPSVRDGRIQR